MGEVPNLASVSGDLVFAVGEVINLASGSGYLVLAVGEVRMQVANVKQRQILPRVGKIWACTPQNLASGSGYLVR